MIFAPMHAARAAEGLAPVAVAASGSTSPLVVFGLGLVAGLLCGPLYARLGGTSRLVSGLQKLRARFRRASVAPAVAAPLGEPPVAPPVVFQRLPDPPPARPVSASAPAPAPEPPATPPAAAVDMTRPAWLKSRVP